MTDSSSFNKISDKNFTNIPKNSKVKFDGLFGKDFIILPEFQTLLNYWTLKKGDRIFPSRKDINPSDLVSILPNIFIFTLVMKDGILVDVTATLLGTAVVDLYGESTGDSVKNAQDVEVGERVLSMCQEALERREPVANQVNVLTPDRPHISVSSLYCPLSTNGTDIDKIIGQVTILNSTA